MMHNWEFHEAFSTLLGVFCGRRAETKACLFMVYKRSMVRCCNKKSIRMSRRTSGNKNNNKAVMYSKEAGRQKQWCTAFESRGSSISNSF